MSELSETWGLGKAKTINEGKGVTRTKDWFDCHKFTFNDSKGLIKA